MKYWHNKHYNNDRNETRKYIESDQELTSYFIIDVYHSFCNNCIEDWYVRTYSVKAKM